MDFSRPARHTALRKALQQDVVFIDSASGWLDAKTTSALLEEVGSMAKTLLPASKC